MQLDATVALGRRRVAARYPKCSAINPGRPVVRRPLHQRRRLAGHRPHADTVRAERSGNSSGCAYTLTVRCTDSSDNASTGTANVAVTP